MKLKKEMNGGTLYKKTDLKNLKKLTGKNLQCPPFISKVA